MKTLKSLLLALLLPLSVLALLPLLALPAQAQGLPAPAPALPLPETPRDLEPDLYLEAMQAISEGRQNDASATLARMIAAGPRHAGEWLDLALLQCALGHADEAEQLFRTIEQRFDPPPGIAEIIAGQRRQGCASWKRQQQWSLTTAYGYDQNVNQGASNGSYTIGGSDTPLQLASEYLPKADRYGLLTADYMADLNQNGDLAFFQLHARQNQHLSHYNTLSVLAGLDHPWRWRRWRLRASASVGALSLGGRLYQNQAQAQLRAVLPLPLPPSLDLSALAGVSLINYRTLSNFNSRIGELRAILAYHSERHQAQLSAGWLKDEAVASRPGGDRNGWNASLYGRSALGERFEGEFDVSMQQWRGTSPYSPGLIDQLRRQRTASVRATLSYALTPNSALQLEWRRVGNHENISIFQYDNHVLQLSWRWRDAK